MNRFPDLPGAEPARVERSEQRPEGASGSPSRLGRGSGGEGGALMGRLSRRGPAAAGRSCSPSTAGGAAGSDRSRSSGGTPGRRRRCGRRPRRRRCRCPARRRRRPRAASSRWQSSTRWSVKPWRCSRRSESATALDSLIASSRARLELAQQGLQPASSRGAGLVAKRRHYEGRFRELSNAPRVLPRPPTPLPFPPTTSPRRPGTTPDSDAWLAEAGLRTRDPAATAGRRLAAPLCAGRHADRARRSSPSTPREMRRCSSASSPPPSCSPAAGVRVPRVLAWDAACGWVLQEDLGERTLYDLGDRPWAELAPWLDAAAEAARRVAALPLDRVAALGSPPLDGHSCRASSTRPSKSCCCRRDWSLRARSGSCARRSASSARASVTRRRLPATATSWPATSCRSPTSRSASSTTRTCAPGRAGTTSLRSPTTASSCRLHSPRAGSSGVAR